MQLTSTSQEDKPLRQASPSLWSRLNRPIVPGVIAFLGWLGFALARWQIWAKGHLSLFVMLPGTSIPIPPSCLGACCSSPPTGTTGSSTTGSRWTR